MRRVGIARAPRRPRAGRAGTVRARCRVWDRNRAQWSPLTGPHSAAPRRPLQGAVPFPETLGVWALDTNPMHALRARLTHRPRCYQAAHGCPRASGTCWPRTLWSSHRRGTQHSAPGRHRLNSCTAHATPPGGSLCYCTCAQEAISTKSAGRKWLVSGLKDHRYLSVTKSATRRQPVGGTPTSKQGLCSGMHLMLSLSTGPWICHISSRVHVWTDSNGNAESPSPRAGGPTGMGCEGSVTPPPVPSRPSQRCIDGHGPGNGVSGAGQRTQHLLCQHDILRETLGRGPPPRSHSAIGSDNRPQTGHMKWASITQIESALCQGEGAGREGALPSPQPQGPSEACNTLYRIGIFDPGGGARALVCPTWVDNPQVAELYGVWMMLKLAVRSKLPQVLMLQDNIAAIWAAVNLRARAPLRKQNRILRAIVMLLRRSGIILHSAYVPSAYQPADPISRLPYFLKNVLIWLRAKPTTARIYWCSTPTAMWEKQEIPTLRNCKSF